MGSRMFWTSLVVMALMTLALQASPSQAGASKVGFGFHGSVSGFPTGAVTITGGGVYDPVTASNTVGATTFAHAAGSFKCTEDVKQGPLAGCAAGEGVKWDTAQLLASEPFKCTLSGEHTTASTDRDTVVLLADFYRAGDGIEESFAHVKMMVSANDERPDLPGIQNIWIAGVGCGTAVVNFSQ
jgi:hypothetical protein